MLLQCAVAQCVAPLYSNSNVMVQHMCVHVYTQTTGYMCVHIHIHTPHHVYVCTYIYTHHNVRAHTMYHMCIYTPVVCVYYSHGGVFGVRVRVCVSSINPRGLSQTIQLRSVLSKTTLNFMFAQFLFLI